MSNQLHPLFAQICRMHGVKTPMTEDELERHHQAIDAAMEADKKADGYAQRNQARALKLQMSQPQDNEGRLL